MQEENQNHQTAVSAESSGGSKKIRLLKKNSRLRLVAFVSVFAILGVAGLLLSSADSPNATSTNPNTVIVQYSLPHTMMPSSVDKLASPMTPPFTLYGNGLLVCGHDTSMPFMTGMQMPTNGIVGQPTTVTLSQSQIQELISKIVATGFMSLNPEYYKLPIIEHQNILQVNLLSGPHNVLYYGDVQAPAAYTKTLSILESYCKPVTTAYQSANPVIRTIKTSTPTPASSSSLVNSSSLTSSTQQTLDKSLDSANAKATQPTGSSSALAPIASGKEAAQTVSSSAAKDLASKLGGKSSGYVSQDGVTYQVGVDQPLPKVSNPLQIDYTAIRSKPLSLGDKIRNTVTPKASAAEAKRPVRIVLLLPNNASNTAVLGQAQVLGQAVHDWYCKAAGSCYDYPGVTIMRGSQTQAYYMTCHTEGCVNNDPLNSVLINVWDKDKSTIYTDAADTLIIPSWPINELAYRPACGLGFVGDGLGIVDLYAPVPSASSGGCFFGSAIAHEMGHTFGLNHTGNSTLMDGSPLAQFGTYCDIGSGNSLIPVCTLDAAQAAQLRGTARYFSAPPSTPKVSWTGWDNLGGVTYSALAAVSWAQGRIDLFARATDNSIAHKAWDNNQWYPWDGLGGTTYDAPAASSWAPGRLDLFVRGTDNAIWHKAWDNNQWYPWDNSVGGGTYSAPTAVSWGRNRIDVFARAGDNSISHKAWDGYWYPWDSIGGGTYSAPAAASWGSGRLDVFARGGDNAIHHRAWANNQWYPWESLGGGTYSAPAAVSAGPNRVDVFARGTDNAVYQKSWTGSSWTDWVAISQPQATYDAPAVASWGPGRIDLFVRGTDNQVYHKATQF